MQREVSELMTKAVFSNQHDNVVIVRQLSKLQNIAATLNGSNVSLWKKKINVNTRYRHTSVTMDMHLKIKKLTLVPHIYFEPKPMLSCYVSLSLY